MTFSREEQAARTTRGRPAAQGFGNQKVRSSQSQSPPAPSDNPLEGWGEAGDEAGAGAEPESGAEDLPLEAVVNVQQMAKKAVELGSQQLAPVLGAAALRGASLQIALNPTAVFQGALGLLSAPALTPEQKQQQQRNWLRDAAQETFGTEALSQLPPSLQWLAPTLALPGVAAGQPAVLGAVEAEVQARQTTGEVS
jgi:hypothetical protein